MIINQNVTDPNILVIGTPKAINQGKLLELMKRYRWVGGRTIYYSTPVDERDGKVKKKYFTESLKDIVQILEATGIKIIGVTDAAYFKFITGQALIESIGKAFKVDNSVFKDCIVVPLLNYSMLYFQPQKIDLLEKSVETLQRVIDGEYKDSSNVLDAITIHLISTKDEATGALSLLLDQQQVAIDIESTGLILEKDSIITIGIAISETESFVFATCPEYSYDYLEIRELLIRFFQKYTGEQLWYNAMFDIPFIISELMGLNRDSLNEVNLIINQWNLTDVMHMKYLTQNGLERRPLGLKDALMPYYGHYDSEINQETLLEYPFEDVGMYNGYDTTGTFLIYRDVKEKLKEYDQDKLFEDYYKPSLKTLIKMKLNGLIIDKERLMTAEEELLALLDETYSTLYSNKIIQQYTEDLKFNAAFKYNQTHKVKKKTPEDFSDMKFNPSSSKQKIELLISVMQYPVIETTAKGNPSVGKDVIQQYLESESNEEHREILQSLLDIADASKILNTFIKGFHKYSTEYDENHQLLHGNYKLHGTVSGRLSSSDPNLQNLPSGSHYGKLVKNLFTAPEGFVFGTADYNALEDRILAEETRDPAKMKIIEDGYDSHSFNTATYFAEELKERGLPYGANVTKEDCEIIKENAPDLRQQSKAVTFGLAYGATKFSISNSLGISPEDAQVIVDNYWKTYYKVKEYYNKYLAKAKSNDGVMITPHKLAIRAPELFASDEQAKEKAERSVLNALIQGLAGQIMVRRITEMQKAIEENGYENDVYIINTVHDAVYFHIRKEPEVIQWVNDNLIADIMVRDYKENQVIHNKAELEIGNDWAHLVELENYMDIDQISGIIKKLDAEVIK